MENEGLLFVIGQLGLNLKAQVEQNEMLRAELSRLSEAAVECEQ